ncbi:MAG: hypothetical protein EZS28_007418 [Streblomastix strix]|uniref:PABC domain-containing protein n=1 Tax=Streblomastix strix TaxID=222440 RepID=A0A5J4WPJ9_9EUKA|nr:MAG: hypothetical protein EZS28_007418 [Streblomastix strix]
MEPQNIQVAKQYDIINILNNFLVPEARPELQELSVAILGVIGILNKRSKKRNLPLEGVWALIQIVLSSDEVLSRQGSEALCKLIVANGEVRNVLLSKRFINLIFDTFKSKEETKSKQSSSSSDQDEESEPNFIKSNLLAVVSKLTEEEENLGELGELIPLLEEVKQNGDSIQKKKARTILGSLREEGIKAPSSKSEREKDEKISQLEEINQKLQEELKQKDEDLEKEKQKSIKKKSDEEIHLIEEDDKLTQFMSTQNQIGQQSQMGGIQRQPRQGGQPQIQGQGFPGQITPGQQQISFQQNFPQGQPHQGQRFQQRNGTPPIVRGPQTGYSNQQPPVVSYPVQQPPHPQPIQPNHPNQQINQSPAQQQSFHQLFQPKVNPAQLGSRQLIQNQTPININDQALQYNQGNQNSILNQPSIVLQVAHPTPVDPPPVNPPTQNGNQTNFDLSSLSQLSDEDKKNSIGEFIYEYAAKDHEELAGKITGIILEHDLSELKQIVQNKQILNKQITDAILLVQQTGGDAE